MSVKNVRDVGDSPPRGRQDRQTSASPADFDVARIRQDFPILAELVRGKPLVYLDNAATTQKPRAVIDAVSRYYEESNANIHRGVYQLSQKATDIYEGARETVRGFVNAGDVREIVFVRGTTEAINLVAQTFGRMRVRPGDEILITHMEHHSNIVPWQLLCQQTGAHLKVAPIDDRGDLELEAFGRLLGPRTRLVALAHMSNALGTINPVRDVIEMAHRQGVPVLLDGAQGIAHLPVDVQDLDVDFYAFSSHKLYGPTGIGVLYGKLEHLESMPPYQGGGDMIRHVTFEMTSFNDVPHKFEAGTPNMAGAAGLGAAIDYVRAVGMTGITLYNAMLLEHAHRTLSQIPGLRLIGTARRKAAVVSFVLDGIHPHDIGTVLDDDGLAVRTGHHCAQPVMDRFGVPATTRASMTFYNTTEEIDALAAGLYKVIDMFR